jgi:hypothetical protein
LGDFFTNSPGADFSYIFSGENLGENSAENFPPKNVGKNGIFRGKNFENSFFQEIPWNFLRKVIFRGKNVIKIGPWSPWMAPGLFLGRRWWPCLRYGSRR